MSYVTARSLQITSPHRAEIVETPIAPLRDDQVLVKAIASAISAGTEMLFYRGLAPEDVSIDESIPMHAGKVQYPLKYGYASVGRVIEIGPQVDRSWLEQLVFAFHPHESHFVTTPDSLMPVPNDIDIEHAALLPNTETAVSFVMDGAPLIGERVAIFGQGIVGLLTTAILARFPLASLLAIDGFEKRRQLALSLGATHVTEPHEVLDASVGDVDLAYELSGNPQALDLAIQTTGPDGRIVIGSWYGQKRAGLNLGGRFHRSRIRLIASQVSGIAPAHRGRWNQKRRFDVAWSMLRSLDAEKVITVRFPLEEAPQAYALIDQHPERVVQVLLTYEQSNE